MHAQPSAPHLRPEDRTFPDTADPAVRVVDGYGVRIRVHHGRLQIEDGIGRQRRSDTYARATCPFRRLLVLGHTGYMSFEAVRWCHDLGIGVVHLDADRSLLHTSARRTGTNRIRRVQALAAYAQVGVDAARYLLREKVRGQAATLSRLPRRDGNASVAVSRALAQIDEAESFDELMDAERLAAAAYWERWVTIPIRFAARDQERVADHWRSFGLRSSPITGSKRHAINPANALLNYLYALLEAETTLALHAPASTQAWGSGTPTSVTATRSPSTSWKPPVPPSTGTSSTSSPRRRFGRETSTRPAAASAASSLRSPIGSPKPCQH